VSWTEGLTVLLDNLPIPDSGDNQGQIATLYGAIAFVLVALIGAVSSYILARMTRRESHHSRGARRAARQHEAWERFLIGNGFDPRKIRTGYETLEEVRRAP
jgi:hypothetical protein